MGNCGFTLAPCAKENKHLVVRNLQRAEDIPPAAMEAGIEWRWTTFPEFLDCLESLPKGINYAGYVGHSAVRTYVMGERAFAQAASEDDLKPWSARCATPSAPARSDSRPRGRRPTRLRMTLRRQPHGHLGRGAAAGRVMGELNAGLFEIAGEGVDRAPDDPGCVTTTSGCATSPSSRAGRDVRVFSRAACRTCGGSISPCWTRPPRGGGRMFAQVHSRSLSALLSFKTQTPSIICGVEELRALPLAEQRRQLRDPEMRRRLIAASGESDGRRRSALRPRAPTTTGSRLRYRRGPHRTVAEVARSASASGRDHDRLALAKDLDLFFLQRSPTRTRMQPSS